MEQYDKEQNYAVFGTGYYMKNHIQYLDTAFRIAAFSDNASEKWFTEPLCDGRKCLPPSKLKDFGITSVMIAIQDVSAAEQVKEQITACGLQAVMAADIMDECIREWDYIQVACAAENGSEVKYQNKIARYIECYINEQACNLRCGYCYVGQHDTIAKKVIKLKHSPEFIARSLSAERLGGRCLISICANGEPLISSDMVNLMELLLREGHYLYVISNGTITKALERLEKLPRTLISHLFIRFSFHYFELKRLNLLGQYFENIKRFHNSGGSYTVFLVGSEDYITEIDKIKSLCMENLGALPHVDYVRDESEQKNAGLKLKTDQDKASYVQIWESFDSEFLRCREKLDGIPGGMCHAGNQAVHLDLMTGTMSRCPRGRVIDHIYENIHRKILFLESPEPCPLPFCICAPVFYSFGLKPDRTDLPTFYELWNRDTQDKGPWIQEEAKEFFSSRLDFQEGFTR